LYVHCKRGEKQHAFSITFFTTNNSGKGREKSLKKSKLGFKIFTIFPRTFSRHFIPIFPLKIVVKKVLIFSPQFPGKNAGEFRVKSQHETL
jgi:hypothetical protein